MQKKQSPTSKHHPPGLAILYEDQDILVVDKPSGLLTIATDKAENRTAYYILTNYVKKGCAKSKKRIFIVHRLDRETSGVIIFAKTLEAKLFLQQHWPETEKKYLAVVHGTPEKRSGTISTLLAENSAHKVYSTFDASKGKLSHTAYEVLKENKGLSLLAVTLLTGRKNQIRVHLQGLGHPVVGDKKYGKMGDGHKRLALHAKSISFDHPSTGKRLTFETEIPQHFKTLIGSL